MTIVDSVDTHLTAFTFLHLLTVNFINSDVREKIVTSELMILTQKKISNEPF